MKDTKRILTITLLTGLAFTNFAFACDPCALFSASEIIGQQEGRWSLAVNEQFDKYKAGPNDSASTERVTRSNSAHVTLAYQSDELWGAAVTVPHLYDKFSGDEGGDSTEDGFGDISVLGRLKLPTLRGESYQLSAGFYAGIELPTGDTSSFRSEETESLAVDREQPAPHDEEHHEPALHHAISKWHHPLAPAAGISGRGLTTGSGSYDYVFGTHFLARYEKIFMLGSFQYTKRTEGSFDYQFADDYVWEVGPGYFIYTWEENSLAIRGVLSGESKAHDRQEGRIVNDSAYTTLYAGPELLLSIAQRWGMSCNVDVPLDSQGDASGLVESDYRIRAGVSYFF